MLPTLLMLTMIGIALVLGRCAVGAEISGIPDRVQRWQALTERHAVAVWGHAEHVARIGAIIERESGGRPDAGSPAGAVGLMQFMPATWREFRARYREVPGHRVEANASIYLGARYLAWLERAHRRIGARCERWRRVLASYNWGIGNVQRATRHGASWIERAPRETRHYLRVLPREHDFIHAGWPGIAACEV